MKSFEETKESKVDEGAKIQPILETMRRDDFKDLLIDQPDP